MFHFIYEVASAMIAYATSGYFVNHLLLQYGGRICNIGYCKTKGPLYYNIIGLSARILYLL